MQSPVAITSLLEEMGADEGPSVDDMFAEGQADDNSQVGSSSTVSFPDAIEVLQGPVNLDEIQVWASRLCVEMMWVVNYITSFTLHIDQVKKEKQTKMKDAPIQCNLLT